MVSRDELYRLVWSEPMTKIAVRFDVSGSYLARICTQLNVPRPERGYWAKFAVGKAPPQVPLPEARPGDAMHWAKDGEPIVAPKPKAPPRRERETKVRIARSRVHRLIGDARPQFENSRPVDEDAYLKPRKMMLVDVTVSRAGLDKAFALANDLFHALESVGHRVVIAPADAKLWRATIDEREIAAKPRERWHRSGLWSPSRPTVVYVETVAVGLSIVEMLETATLRYMRGKYIRASEYIAPRDRSYLDHSFTTTRDIPSQRMRIVAYSPYGRVGLSKQWDETKSESLRGQVRTIVEAIEAMAPDIVAKLEEADREAEILRQQRLAEEERRRRAEDRRCVAQSIADSKVELRQAIDRWSESMSIENFLAGVERRAGYLADLDRCHVLERLALARAFLGSTDPLDFFREWKTPGERYAPRYSDAAEEGSQSADQLRNTAAAPG